MNYSKEEKEAIERIKEKINNVLPEYEEVEIEGKPPYKLNILQLEARWTKETANTVQTVLNLIRKQEEIIDKFSKALVNCVGTCPIDYNDDFKNDCENCQDTLEKCWIEFFSKEVEKECEN